MRLTGLLVPASAMAVLVYIASAYAAELLFSRLLVGAAWLEVYIIGVQVFKTGAMFVFKDLRKATPAVVVDLYGADLLILPVLGGAFLATGAPAISAMLIQILAGWFAGVALGGLFYGSYRIGRSMLNSGELKTIIPGSLIASEVGLLFYGSARSAESAGKGIAGLLPSIIAGNISISAEGVWLFGALGVLFAALVVYACNGTSWEGPTAANFSLLFALLSVSAVLGCVALVSFLSLPMSFAFVPMTLAAAAVSWWAGHGR